MSLVTAAPPVLRGILPAIVTPIDEHERFQPDAFEQLVARLYGAGVHGLYVCGQTGEGMQLSTPQRKAAAEAAVRLSSPGKIVIVHAGAYTTSEAVELAQHAAAIGAHAVSALPPAGHYSFSEIHEYYRLIAEASEAPLLIYYFPSFSTAIQTIEELETLCRIPNVAGLKFTSADLFRLWAVRQTGATVFNGFDEMLAAGLLMGASGGIGSTYNLLPEHYVRLYGHAQEGRWDEARKQQDLINEFIRVILRFGVNPSLKAILAWTKIDCGKCIAPRRVLTPIEEADLHSQIKKTKLGAELLSAYSYR